MATTRETTYKGKKITLTVAKQGPQYVGTYEVEGDPPIRGSGADATDQDVALDHAESAAKGQIDKLR